MSIKSHKIALRTNNKHEQWFHSQCGYARFAFNSGLADFKDGLSNDDFRSKVDLNNRWNTRKKSYDWTRQQDQRAGHYAIENLGKAIENWKEMGYPLSKPISSLPRVKCVATVGIRKKNCYYQKEPMTATNAVSL